MTKRGWFFPFLLVIVAAGVVTSRLDAAEYTAAGAGTVRIRLTDGHNRPIAHHEVWLDETNSTKEVRPFGFQWVIPDGPYHGKTDKNGYVSIRGVPMRKPMMVVTRFGPRFDEFVEKNGNPSGGSLDVMKFEGAVYAGRTAHVVLAQDRELTGTVTDANGKPLAGVEVSLSDTGFGHMGGYPGTTLDVQKTDERGVYRFNRLPNCHFSLWADGEKGMAVLSRVAKGPWELISIEQGFSTSQSVLLVKPNTVCDFRIVQTARITVVFKGTPAQIKGWSAWLWQGGEELGGQELDYAPSHTTMERQVLPGALTIVLVRNDSSRRITAEKLTLKPGESRTIEISMADVLKRKR